MAHSVVGTPPGCTLKNALSIAAFVYSQTREECRESAQEWGIVLCKSDQQQTKCS